MHHPLARELCNPRVGQRFNVGGVDYVMGGVLGDGAAGLVRKATRVSDSRVVAVKLLAPDAKYIDEAAFDDVAARFKREGERGVRLRHPHLVAIEGYTDNDRGAAFADREPTNPLLVMELVRGRTLDSYIRDVDEEDEGKFRVTKQRLNIAIQIVTAAEDLHEKRLVHRDIKPANVFLTKTSNSREMPIAKLGDFGVMKWGDFNAAVSTGVLTTTTQTGIGTLKYMSPEAALRPKDVTTRSDVFSIGITLFELLTGQILASAYHVFEIMNARLARGTTQSRFHDMGYAIKSEDEVLAELLLDMHLRGQTRRPSTEKICGRLEWEYEARFGSKWQDDLYQRSLAG